MYNYDWDVIEVIMALNLILINLPITKDFNEILENLGVDYL